jgi:hypothetical protein
VWDEAPVSHNKLLISEALHSSFSSGSGRSVLVVEAAGRVVRGVVVAKARLILGGEIEAAYLMSS